MQLVIIAGGEGTRLGLKDIPKPMALLGNKPIIQHQIDLALRHGVDDIVIITGYLSEVIADYFKENPIKDVKLTIVKEEEAMGTAGCLKYAHSVLRDRFLVFYGDLYLDFDITKFIKFDEELSFLDYIATIVVQPNAYPEEADLLEVNNYTVTNFYPKPRDVASEYANLSCAAVYILSKEVLYYIDSLYPQDFGKDIFPKLIKKYIGILAYETDEILKDLGTIEKLEGVRNDYFKNTL